MAQAISPPSTPPSSASSMVSSITAITTGSAAETDRAHGRDLARASGHRRIHGVQRAEHRADRHDRADHRAQHLDDAWSGRRICLE